MPVSRATKGGFADRLADIASRVKDFVEADRDNLYGVRELCKAEAVSGGKVLDGYLVALAIGILWAGEQVEIEHRAGKLLVGSGAPCPTNNES